MPWCPECKKEYREGFAKCSECGHDLVGQLESETCDQDDTDSKEAFLVTAANSIEADLIEVILKDNDIPVLRKYREAGGYLMVFMGGTVYGVDLYVPDMLLDKARDLLETSRSASYDTLFPDNVEQDDPTEESNSAEEQFDNSDIVEDDPTK